MLQRAYKHLRFQRRPRLAAKTGHSMRVQSETELTLEKHSKSKDPSSSCRVHLQNDGVVGRN